MTSQKKIIRVFPRRTNSTPDDDLAIVGRGPTLYDEADEIHVSVAFTWDMPKAEDLVKQWGVVAPVKIGGPAISDSGGEFIPGLYLKRGAVITSRGCPNKCWFCRAWKNEGNEVRELKIYDGWNLCDNNIFACSIEHQQAVYDMLSRQPEKPRFTGGLEAARMTEWNVEQLVRLKPDYIYFAYDTPDDYEPLFVGSKLLKSAGLMKHHNVGCYVLIDYKGDTFEKAEKRLISMIKLGYFPQAMLFDKGYFMPDPYRKEWRSFAREWANKIIVGSKMKEFAL